MTRHPPEFQDTDAAALKVWLELTRKKTAGEKPELALKLSDRAMEPAGWVEGHAHAMGSTAAGIGWNARSGEKLES